MKGERERGASKKKDLLSTHVVVSFLLGLALAGLASYQFCNKRAREKAPSYHERSCFTSTPLVFQDMADGDRKAVGVDVEQSLLVIKPYESEENWEVRATLSETFCNATVDFRVPGKPNPPPVTLLATIWIMNRPLDVTAPGKRNAIEFTDPSGTLAPPNVPLNTWVQASVR